MGEPLSIIYADDLYTRDIHRNANMYIFMLKYGLTNDLSTLSLLRLTLLRIVESLCRQGHSFYIDFHLFVVGQTSGYNFDI